MLGAIAGDIIGSVYEANNIKVTTFPLFRGDCRFTDDTVLTVATADSLLSGSPYGENYKQYYQLYPQAGFGEHFHIWARSPGSQPYNSWGNGSAMRVSPIGFALETLDEVLKEARASAEVTHNHPEGIKGAQAVASAIFLARSGKDKAEIKAYIEDEFAYSLSTPLDVIRPKYTFDISCQGTVPVAITAFLESEDLEDAIRKAISLGGDSDTIGCITGGIAHAYYGKAPDHIRDQVFEYLDSNLGDVTYDFCEAFDCF